MHHENRPKKKHHEKPDLDRLSQHARFLLRVTALSYLPASGSLYWGFGPGVYNFVRTELNGRLEAYASPFNQTMPLYCSPFWLDKVFFSCGSFYEFVGVGGGWRLLGSWDAEGLRGPEEKQGGKNTDGGLTTVVANPPYIEADLELCAKTIAELLSAFVQDNAEKRGKVGDRRIAQCVRAGQRRETGEGRRRIW